MPQGSVLGPLLFSIYINDITKFIMHSSASLFADDTSIFFRDRKLESQEKFLGDIEAVDDWCAHNKLTISSSKSKLIQFGRKVLSESLVALKGDILEYTDTDEILIDEDLTFRDHIDKVC